MLKYSAKFDKVLNYIENHIDEDLTIEILSNVVCMSKFHFHRLFSAYIGMSILSLIKMLRFKRAAYQLAFRKEMKIIDIALMNGYESAAAFSRGFSEVFIQSPRKFRNNTNWDLWYQQYQSILKLRNKPMNTNEQPQVEIVNFPETNIAVLEHRASPSLLGDSIAMFIRWRKEHGLPPSKSKTFNVIYDDPSITSPNDYRFDIACAIKSEVVTNSQGIINKAIPAGLCAKLRFKGSDDRLGLVIQFLYSQWLMNSNFELRNFPLFVERVNFYPDVNEAGTITDIYLPVIGVKN
jgi:AraC family transcriptional regulator